MKRVKALLCNGMIVMALTIVGCADYASRSVEEEEGQTQSLISEYERETLADLQTETAAAPETEMMTEQYGSVEVSLLDYDSFQDRMTAEEWEGLELYFPVLKENAEFHYTDFSDGIRLNKDGEPEPLKEGEYPLYYRHESKVVNIMDINFFAKDRMNGEIEIEEIRVFDLDGDGVQELIIQWMPVRVILVLHREKDEFYAWQITYRGFEGLNTDGIYISSDGAGANRWKCIRFDNGSWLEEVLCEEDWGKYYVHGEPVEEEAFREQVEAFDKAAEVTRYEAKAYDVCGLPLNTEAILSENMPENVSEQYADGIVKIYNPSEENGVMKTYYELEDGTWECEGIAYPYRLALSGRLPNAAGDSHYVVLTDNAELTFEQVSKSMYSSSMKDIEVMRGSVIVEWTWK